MQKKCNSQSLLDVILPNLCLYVDTAADCDGSVMRMKQSDRN